MSKSNNNQLTLLSQYIKCSTGQKLLTKKFFFSKDAQISKYHFKSRFLVIFSSNYRHCLVLKIPFSDHIFAKISKYHSESLQFLSTSKYYAPLPPDGISTTLANSLRAFFINDRPAFGNGPRTLPRNPPDCIILDIWIFDNLILFEKLFLKTL